jgi:hypothetical protein
VGAGHIAGTAQPITTALSEPNQVFEVSIQRHHLPIAVSETSPSVESISQKGRLSGAHIDAFIIAAARR